jgi:plastocyanin domain-containing protein
MQKNTIISIIISLVIVGGTLYFVSDKKDSTDTNNEITQSQNVEIRDGIQYVTVTAQGGYSPRISVIQPDIPTKLIVKTNGTYDCSASLSIQEVGFQKILQPTGEEVIDLGTLAKGGKVQGVCGMGMYNFQIKSS